jgi:hypothetical protein
LGWFYGGSPIISAWASTEWLLRCAVCQQTAFGPENSKPPEATVDSSGEKVFELYCINMF